MSLTGAWCSCCYGTRWWTERHEPKGWRCMACHPPDHLRREAIRREGEADLVPLPRQEPEPLFQQAGIPESCLTLKQEPLGVVVFAVATRP